jgi:hypothetical protein
MEKEREGSRRKERNEGRGREKNKSVYEGESLGSE